MLYNLMRYLINVNYLKWLLLMIATLTRPLMADTNHTRFAKFFMVDRVEVVPGKSVKSFEQARYHEFGPLVLIEIIKTGDKVIYYTEVNDEGGIVVSMDKFTNEILIIIQAHDIQCDQLLHLFPYKENIHFLCKVNATSII